MKKNYLIPETSAYQITLTTTLCGSPEGHPDDTIKGGGNLNPAPARMNLITK